MSTMAVCFCNVDFYSRLILLLLVHLMITQISSSSEQSDFQQAILPKNIVIVVLSQPTSYHENRTRAFEKHIDKQFSDLNQDDRPSLIVTYKKWPDEIGTWTVFPMLKDLSSEFSTKNWIFFCEEETRVNIHKLALILQRYDSSKELFLGKPLKDTNPSIIHHYLMKDNFEFADFSAGFLLSLPLIKILAKKWPSPPYKEDFNIDPKHELSLYIWNSGEGVSLTTVPELCTISLSDSCVTNMQTLFPNCDDLDKMLGPEESLEKRAFWADHWAWADQHLLKGDPIPDDDLFVAVKTCEDFHKTRVPIVKETWAKESNNVVFVSEKEDKDIPTISLGVPNTKRGHCGKTKAILDKFVMDKKWSKKPWLLIADDDTIISLKRLRKLLACYNPAEEIALGERYGFRAASGLGGYNYITGGGGMIFSRPAAKLLSDICKCPALDTPDDMLLGMCLSRERVPVIHSVYFHQARPDDYAKEFLQNQIPVSFHKHWMNDPVKVYEDWLVDLSNSNEELSKDEL